MKKFNLQTNTITLNKDLISIFSVELKSVKYILYSGLSINENLISHNDFEKMEFNEDIQILPKKKLNDAKLSITQNNNISKVLYLGNPVYYLKDSKNIIVNDPQLRLITSFGKLYIPQNSPITISPYESNLVTDILNKNKTVNNSQNTSLLPDLSNIKSKNDNISENNIVQEENNIVQEENNIVQEENNIIQEENNIVQEENNIVQEENNIVQEENNIVQEENNIVEINNDIIENIEVFDENNTNDFEIIIENNMNLSDNIVSDENNIIKSDIIEEIDKSEIIDDTSKNILIKEENIPIEISQSILKNDDTILKSSPELFSLENILSDFNKLFDISDTAKLINVTNKNTQNKDTKVTKVTKVTKQESVVQPKSEVITIKNIYNIYTLRINYNNSFYKISTIKLKETLDLNFSNLYKTKIFECNIINNINISFELETFNSSYLISVFNQKYLIIKNDNIVIITNLQSRQSTVTKNNDNFKLTNYDYTLYNGTLLLSMINKKIFDNNYGTSYNVYMPRSIGLI